MDYTNHVIILVYSFNYLFNPNRCFSIAQKSPHLYGQSGFVDEVLWKLVGLLVAELSRAVDVHQLGLKYSAQIQAPRTWLTRGMRLDEFGSHASLLMNSLQFVANQSRASFGK